MPANNTKRICTPIRRHKQAWAKSMELQRREPLEAPSNNRAAVAIGFTATRFFSVESTGGATKMFGDKTFG